jgi:hypothetical protein
MVTMVRPEGSDRMQFRMGGTLNDEKVCDRW